MFGSTQVHEQLFWLMEKNKTHDTSLLTDMHLSSILKVISAQDLKPNIRTLTVNKKC
jgi:hypothetical protein